MNAKLSSCLQPDDSFVVAGMSDGLVQFLHRREPKTEEERRAELLTKPKMGYTRYTDYRPAPGDIVVRPVRCLLFIIVNKIKLYFLLSGCQGHRGQARPPPPPLRALPGPRLRAAPLRGPAHPRDHGRRPEGAAPARRTQGGARREGREGDRAGDQLCRAPRRRSQARGGSH